MITNIEKITKIWTWIKVCFCIYFLSTPLWPYQSNPSKNLFQPTPCSPCHTNI